METPVLLLPNSRRICAADLISALLATPSLVIVLAGLGARPNRAIVVSQVLALPGSWRSPGGGNMGGERMGRVQHQGPTKSLSSI